MNHRAWMICGAMMLSVMSSAVRGESDSIDRDLAFEQSRQRVVSRSIQANSETLVKLLEDLRSNGLAQGWGEAEMTALVEALGGIEDEPLAQLIVELREARRDLARAGPRIGQAAEHSMEIERRLAALLEQMQLISQLNEAEVEVAGRAQAREELEQVIDRQQKLREELSSQDDASFEQRRSESRAAQEQLAGQVRSIGERVGQSSGEDAEGEGQEAGEARAKLNEAQQAMREAGRSLGEGERARAMESQRAAEGAMREALDALDRQIASDKAQAQQRKSESGGEPGASGDRSSTDAGQAGAMSEGTDRAMASGRAAGDASHGDGSQSVGVQAGGSDGGSGAWQPLDAQRRAAVFESYVRELPVEYRALLEQYYEVIGQ